MINEIHPNIPFIFMLSDEDLILSIHRFLSLRESIVSDHFLSLGVADPDLMPDMEPEPELDPEPEVEPI